MATCVSFALLASLERLAAMLFFLRRSQYFSSLFSSATICFLRFRTPSADVLNVSSPSSRTSPPPLPPAKPTGSRVISPLFPTDVELEESNPGVPEDTDRPSSLSSDGVVGVGGVGGG